MRRLCCCLLCAVACCFAGGPAHAADLQFQLWTGGEEGTRQYLGTIKNRAVFKHGVLPTEGVNLFVDAGDISHDKACISVECTTGFRKGREWPAAASVSGTNLYGLMRPPAVFLAVQGDYRVSAWLEQGGKVVVSNALAFRVLPRPPPANTDYMRGRKDAHGVDITTSEPVKLPPLNTTPRLKDYDYPFAPQRAVCTINYERFPPFRMNKRFMNVWDSRRFGDEPQYGGPLNRGFSMVTDGGTSNDVLEITERAFFEYPGWLNRYCEKRAAENPEKYRDLLGWAKYRSAWVSASNAYEMGWICYEDGAGGKWRDFGLYGWDEEEMWHAIGSDLFKNHPEFLPEELHELKEKDPNAEDPATVAAAEASYVRWWGEFLGWYYQGARDSAASRGTDLKIFHYGSASPAMYANNWRNPAKAFDERGVLIDEDPKSLRPWFITDGKLDIHASKFFEVLDYSHRDDYFHVVFPQNLTMYEKVDGAYVLDGNGRRTIRRDVAEDDVYNRPTHIGYEDYSAGPRFLTEMITGSESALYWLNGGTYYKQYPLATPKRLIPTMRPGSQETYGCEELKKLGSRPVNPYMAEAAIIFNFIVGIEGVFIWDRNRAVTPVGQPGFDEETHQTFGDLEFIIKGMHRVSHFRSLLEGKFQFIRPVAYIDREQRDHPLIRGILNGNDLLLAMTNPYLDTNETQKIEIWYDQPVEQMSKARWKDAVTLQPRCTHLFQCRLPTLPRGAYDPDKLRFRYTCKDGSYEQTYIVSGNYMRPYDQ